MKILVLVLLLLTCCTKAQPELRETKEVQTSIPGTTSRKRTHKIDKF